LNALKLLPPLSFTRCKPRFNYFETKLPVPQAARNSLVIQKLFVFVRPGSAKAFGAGIETTRTTKVVMVVLIS